MNDKKRFNSAADIKIVQTPYIDNFLNEAKNKSSIEEESSIKNDKTQFLRESNKKISFHPNEVQRYSLYYSIVNQGKLKY